jgi:ribonuclease D
MISKPPALDQTDFKFIDTSEGLVWLCNHLGKNNRSKIREIAVDLEHHSYRSFLGFTCLMQISTRSEDFLVDTIKLRADMHQLNEIFTDWTLLKVLHGADSDIEWLQKDFGIYVVNMFDTGQAARLLQYPHFSLSYLLQKFCNITAQKHYQLADWRQRPLDEAMIKYAREDTHYLLYIYDNLCKELTAASVDSLGQVYEKSRLICKKVYKKPVFYSKGFLNLCQSNAHLNAKQMKAIQELYKWRDRIARESDESCEYVLKNHQLLKIAELLPREIYGILALCNPISSIVEANVHEIHDIVKSAREWRGTMSIFDIKEENERNLNNSVVTFAAESKEAAAANNSVLNNSLSGGQQTSALDSIVHSVKYDPESILNCPHDFPHNNERQSDQMEEMDHANADADPAHETNLVDLLIKPTSTSDFHLPVNMLHSLDKSSLSELFLKSTNLTGKSRATKSSAVDKVKSIKMSIENPFEMYLPVSYCYD